MIVPVTSPLCPRFTGDSKANSTRGIRLSNGARSQLGNNPCPWNRTRRRIPPPRKEILSRAWIQKIPRQRRTKRLRGRHREDRFLLIHLPRGWSLFLALPSLRHLAAQLAGMVSVESLRHRLHHVPILRIRMQHLRPCHHLQKRPVPAGNGNHRHANESGRPAICNSRAFVTGGNLRVKKSTSRVVCSGILPPRCQKIAPKLPDLIPRPPRDFQRPTAPRQRPPSPPSQPPAHRSHPSVHG